MEKLKGVKIVGFIDPRLLNMKSTVKVHKNKGLAKAHTNKLLAEKAAIEEKQLAERIAKLFK